MDTCTKFENKASLLITNNSSDSVFLAAVSGGADSMAMLAALCALKDSGLIGKDALFCLHVEHALRSAEESLGDAEFVRAFCQSHGVECRIKHIPPGKIESLAQRKGIGIEAAARFFRYKALSREAARLGARTLILTGHTKDDLLETALMRILRGVGPAGLAAMQESSEQRTGNKKHNEDRAVILRPLLSMSRADVISYLQAKRITWREDSSNTDEKFLRNKIRHRLVPLLNELFPSWKTGVGAMAETQSLVSSFLTGEAAVRIAWKKNFHNEPLRTEIKKEGLVLSTDKNLFFAQPLIIREEAIFQGINTLCASAASVPPCEKIRTKSIKRSVIRRFCAGTITAADLGKIGIRQEKGKIFLFKAPKEFFECGVSRLIIQSRLDNL